MLRGRKSPEERLREELSAGASQVKTLDFRGYEDFNVIEEYEVDSFGIVSKVRVAEKDGEGFYLVQEPSLQEDEVKGFQIIASLVSSSGEFAQLRSREEYEAKIVEIVQSKKDVLGVKISDDRVRLVAKMVAREVLGYGVIDTPMSDENVSDVACPSHLIGVIVKHRSYPDFGWMRTNISLQREELDLLVQKIAGRFGKELSVMVPKAEITTDDGSRIMLTYKTEISKPSSSLSIRKFPKSPWSIVKLVSLHSLSPAMAAYLWYLVDKKRFLIISGPMGSGKTTLLGALLSLINTSYAVCTCEDTAELSLPAQFKWFRLMTRKAGVFGAKESEVSLYDLVMLSLRTGADYVVVGEVRGAEIQALVQAAGTGMGCATTFHADSFANLISRMKGRPLSVDDSFLMTIGSICFVGTIPIGSEKKMGRRVIRIEEPVWDGELKPKTVFTLDPSKDVFEPDSVKEAVENSFRLKEIAEFTKEDPVEELSKRRKVIEEALERKLFTSEELANFLNRKRREMRF
jgi:flagellar protein FlaI